MESQSVSKNKVENIGNKNIPQPFIVYQCVSAGQTHQFWELGSPICDRSKSSHAARTVRLRAWFHESAGVASAS